MTLSAALAAAVILTSAGPDLIRPHQDQETRLPDVAVTGGTVEERALDFVGRVAGPPRGRGVARWNMPVCAAAVNLDNAPAQVILDRIGDVARSLDLRVGAPGCEPNLVVIFTSDGSALARSMVTQNRRIFDPGVGGISRGSRELEAFQTGDAPVRWWSLSVAFDSATGQRAARVPGDIPSERTSPFSSPGISCAMSTTVRSATRRPAPSRPVLACAPGSRTLSTNRSSSSMSNGPARSTQPVSETIWPSSAWPRSPVTPMRRLTTRF